MLQFLRDLVESMLAILLAWFLVTTLLSIILPPIPDKTGPMVNESMTYHRR